MPSTRNALRDFINRYSNIATDNHIWYWGNSTTTRGKLYYLTTTNTWALTNASTNAKGSDQVLAIALGTDSRQDGMLLRGRFTVPQANITSWTQGKALYMAETTDGLMTTVAPNGPGQVVRVVGHCMGKNTGILGSPLYFNPEPGWLELV